MIIPALDIINGKVVRLFQGDYNKVRYYDVDIYKVLESYLDSGAKIIHLVDLDGAKNPDTKQKEIISQIIRSFSNHIQIGGGIRNSEDIEYFLSLGVKRVVIGSSIINNMERLKNWVISYGNDTIVAALDIYIDSKKNKKIFINGWKKDTGIFLEYILEKLSFINIKHVLCTDISKDGTLSGPNFKLYQNLTELFKNFYFQASGGISSINDIVRLKKIGLQDVIIGRSLLENKFTVSEAISCWQKGLSLV